MENQIFLYLLFAILILSTIIKSKKLAFFIFFVIIVSQLIYGAFSFSGENFNYLELINAIFYPVISTLVVVIIYKKIFSLNSENQFLKEQFSELEQKSEDIFKDYQNEKNIRINLEKRILKDDSFALKLQQHISSLSSLNPKEIKSKLLEIVCEFINAKDVAYYEFKDSTFAYEQGIGDEAHIKIVDSKSLLYNKLINAQELLNVKDDEELSQYGFLLVGVLRDGKSKPIGFISINKIDFLDINHTTISLFNMLCSWASIAMEKASAYELALQESIKCADTHIFNMDYFIEVFNREYKLAKRYKSYFSVLILAFKDEGLNAELMSIVNLNLQHVLRDIDSVFIDHKHKNKLFVVLQMTDLTGANVVKEKISNSLQNIDINCLVSSIFVNEKTMPEDIDSYKRMFA